MMRVLMVNRLVDSGGAARAARRLQLGLLRLGVDVGMLVDSGTGGHTLQRETPVARFLARHRSRIDQVPLRLLASRPTTRWSVGWFPSRIARQIDAYGADVVHLHWVGGGQMPLWQFARIAPPVVWTLHDMWAFTGGCHYGDGCTRFREQCGACPQLRSTRKLDASHAIWRAKHRLWQSFSPTIVTPSRWLAREVKTSSLLGHARVEVIPNGLDLDVYRSMDKAQARRALGLPQQQRLLLFGAMGATSDPRKGFQHLAAALRRLAAEGRGDTMLVVVGAERPTNPPEFGIPDVYMGSMDEDAALSRLYSAADVTLLPSVQDNLPNMAMESLACGTPVVAFDVGGIPDMVEHQANGYLARAFDAEDFAEGIRWVLETKERHAALGARAARKVSEEFSIETVARRHLELYAELTVPGANA